MKVNKKCLNNLTNISTLCINMHQVMTFPIIVVTYVTKFTFNIYRLPLSLYFLFPANIFLYVCIPIANNTYYSNCK